MFKITNKTDTYQPFGIYDFERIISFNIASYSPFEVPIDLNIFKKTTYMTFCQLLNISSKGDVSVFKNINGIYHMSLFGEEVIGDITSFSNLDLNLTSTS